MARIKNITPRLTTVSTTRLQQQPAAAVGDSWRAGKTTSERGYGWLWQQARLEYLFDNPLCVYCQALGYVTAATVVDHITPHRGDQTLFWDRNNWQSLCKPCHDTLKKAEDYQK